MGERKFNNSFLSNQSIRKTPTAPHAFQSHRRSDEKKKGGRFDDPTIQLSLFVTAKTNEPRYTRNPEKQRKFHGPAGKTTHAHFGDRARALIVSLITT